MDLGVDNPNDAGIDSVIVDPQTSFNRTYSGRVIARIHNHRKDQAVTVPVSLTLNDKEIERKSAVVPANASVLVEYTALDLPLGYSKGRVRIEAKDALETDNDFLFTLNRRDKLKLLVVDSGTPEAESLPQPRFQFIGRIAVRYAGGFGRQC